MELPFPLTFRSPGIQGLGGLRGWKQGQPLGLLDLERGELECGVGTWAGRLVCSLVPGSTPGPCSAPLPISDLREFRKPGLALAP